VCFGCVPILSILVQSKDMSTLSPFSLMADCANLLGLGAVLFQDYEKYKFHHDSIQAADLPNLLYVIAISIYSLEGVGLILPLESSCKKRDAFPFLLMKVVFGITLFMIIFGCCGYIAFGSKTESPISLNLTVGSWATLVKLALCFALYLTYPIMMFPVNQVMENIVFGGNAGEQYHPMFRISVVLATATVAYVMPDFKTFLHLVGSSICTLLGFIIPCYIHLQVFESDIQPWEKLLDYTLIIFASLFGILGTYTSFLDLFYPETGGRY